MRGFSLRDKRETYTPDERNYSVMNQRQRMAGDDDDDNDDANYYALKCKLHAAACRRDSSSGSHCSRQTRVYTIYV